MRKNIKIKILKTIIFIFFIGMFNGISTIALENKIVFKDSNLEIKIREILNKPNGDINENDLLEITRLDLRYVPITSLEGIEKLTNLTYLDLFSTGISDITPVSTLENLEMLDLRSNNIVDISKLKDLKKLERLYLEYNDIVDFNVLKYMENLQALSLGTNNEDNNIFDIALISNNKKMRDLRIQNVLLKNVDYFSQLINLSILDLTRTKIKDISSFYNLNNLNYLALIDTEIDNIDSLSGKNNLKTLLMQGSNVIDISPIENLISLETLYLENSKIEDITPLNKLENLKSLSLYDNKIENIGSLSNLNNLNFLCLSYNKIKDISCLSMLPLINYLRLDGNKISSFQALQNMKNLNVLIATSTGFSNNDIKFISGNSNLREVVLSNNPITEIGGLDKLSKECKIYLWGFDTHPLKDHRYKAMEKKLKHIKEEIDKSNSSIEKILRINDYINRISDYSQGENYITTNENSILLYGKGFCSTYTNTTSLLAGMNSIEDEPIGGAGHAWNIVNLNNEWYHLDAMWNGKNSYSYFMISDETIQTLRSGPAYDWTSEESGIPKLVPCDSKYYEKLADFLNYYEDSSQVFMDDNFIYYLDFNTNNIIRTNYGFSEKITIKKDIYKIIQYSNGLIYYLAKDNILHSIDINGNNDKIIDKLIVIESNYFQNQNNVPLNIDYEIKFNKNVEIEDRNKIYFLSSSNERINTSILLENGSVKITPLNEFNGYEEYELVIESGALKENDRVINEEIKRYFTTTKAISNFTLNFDELNGGINVLSDGSIEIKVKASEVIKPNMYSYNAMTIADSKGNYINNDRNYLENIIGYSVEEEGRVVKFKFNKDILKEGETYNVIIPYDRFESEVSKSSMKEDYIFKFTVPYKKNNIEDVNNDGIIDILDIAIVANLYGRSNIDSLYNIEKDINKDGIIDIFDLVLISKKI